MPPTDDGPHLVVGRLRLRPPGEGDLDAIIRAAQDESVVRWTNMPVPYFRNHADAWLVAHRFDPTAPQTWWSHPTWVLVDAENTWLATIEVRPDGAGAADLAFLTDSSHVPSLVTGIRAVCRWAFEVLGVQVIRWVGPTGYASAIDLVQRARFRVHQDSARLGFVHRNARVDAVTADLLPGDLEFNTEEHRVTGLTEREHEVLFELAAGRSNREIANALQISENTVKNHVRSILEKLQAVSRVEAVVIGVQRGLVRVPSG